MKLTVLQEDFAKAVQIASKFSAAKAQLPILGNLMFSANGTKLTVSSTNLEISVCLKIGAKIEETGKISIPSRVINDLVVNLPKGQLEIETENEQLKMKSGSFNSRVLGMNALDFPKIPESVDKAKSFSLPLSVFSPSVSKVLFAVGMDETRPVLTGVLFVFNENSLVIVATDGFRLSRKIISFKSSMNKKIIIPKAILNEVSKVAGEEGNLFFEVLDSEKQIVFGSENLFLSSRFLEGEYPDYEKIIPKNPEINVFLDKDDFMQAVRLASVFARESSNVVKLKLKKDSLIVEAESSMSGKQETKIDAKVEGDYGDKFEISFNYRFLEDFLHSVTGREVKLGFTSVDKAALFLDTGDSDYLHLIMPVRMQE